MQKNKNKYMSATEVSKIFGVSIGTVYYWIKTKGFFRAKVTGSRYGILRSEVEHYQRNGFAPRKYGQDRHKSMATKSAKKKAAKKTASMPKKLSAPAPIAASPGQTAGSPELPSPAGDAVAS